MSGLSIEFRAHSCLIIYFAVFGQREEEVCVIILLFFAYLDLHPSNCALRLKLVAFRTMLAPFFFSRFMYTC